MTTTRKTVIEIRLSADEKNTLANALKILENFTDVCSNYTYATEAKTYLETFLDEDLDGGLTYINTNE